MENQLLQYGSFIKEIKDLIYRRQYEAMKKVNKELIQLYWEIGKEIDRKQQEQGWGKSVIEILAKELQREFPGIKGFSASNLWRMRTFFIEYSNLALSVREIEKSKLKTSGAEIDNTNLAPMVQEVEKTILPPMVAEISWSKNIVILEKCKDPFEREFYIKMTKKYGWTKDVIFLETGFKYVVLKFNSNFKLLLNESSRENSLG